MTDIYTGIDAFEWHTNLCDDCLEFDFTTKIDDQFICRECLIKYHPDAIKEMIELSA